VPRTTLASARVSALFAGRLPDPHFSTLHGSRPARPLPSPVLFLLSHPFCEDRRQLRPVRFAPPISGRVQLLASCNTAIAITSPPMFNAASSFLLYLSLLPTSRPSFLPPLPFPISSSLLHFSSFSSLLPTPAPSGGPSAPSRLQQICAPAVVGRPDRAHWPTPNWWRSLRSPTVRPTRLSQTPTSLGA